MQQIRPQDLFCYYAICAMALRSNFEIARVDHTLSAPKMLTLPDAKWWKPCSNDVGEMAFKEKRELFTSNFNLMNGSGAYKYNFRFSGIIDKNANVQEVKVYRHCGGLHTIFIRQAPSLRVYLSISKRSLRPHMISLKKEDGVVIFEKEFANDGSDITLGQIMSAAKCKLVNNNHVTYQGLVDIIFEGLVITMRAWSTSSSRAWSTSSLSTVLAEDRIGPNKRRKKSA